MEPNHYLGMIVGYRKVLSENHAKKELEKETRAKQLGDMFAKTDIEGIWEAVRDVRVPHFNANKRLAGIDMSLNAVGRLKRLRGAAYGLQIKDEFYGGPRWLCVRNGEKIEYSIAQPCMYDSTRFVSYGTATPKGVAYTAKDMRDSFLSFMTLVVPAYVLYGIEPVDVCENTETNKRRKIMAPA